MAPSHKEGVFFKGLVEPFGKDNMVKFKCIHTGNVFTFTVPHDIQTMREHAEYEEVIEQTITDILEQEPTKRSV